MKKLLLIVIALGALTMSVACLDITPYPVVVEDTDAAADAGGE